MQDSRKFEMAVKGFIEVVYLKIINNYPAMSIDLEQRKIITETRQSKIIFPNSLNDHATLFGGEVLKWMDEVAYITAIRFCRQEMVTVSADKIVFRKPVPAGCILELVGIVTHVSHATITVTIEIFAETFHNDHKEKVLEGKFRFAAIDDNHKLTRISPPL